MLIRKFILKIRRRQNPFYNRLFLIAKAVHNFSFPVIQPLHSFLYNEWCFRTSLWHNFWRIVYYEPMFKSQCLSVGKQFRMEYAGNGSTKIFGDLQINVGDNVHIFDNTSFVGLKIFDNPKLTIGDNTYLGPKVRIFIGKEVLIGRNCLIASKIITDNPGHDSHDVMARLNANGGPPAPQSIRPIRIGDFVWLPLETVVYPGTHVGDGVVARLGTHLSGVVPPFCLVGGNPMRILRKLPIPKDLREIVGEERYQQYLDVHNSLDL